MYAGALPHANAGTHPELLDDELELLLDDEPDGKPLEEDELLSDGALLDDRPLDDEPVLDDESVLDEVEDTLTETDEGSMVPLPTDRRAERQYNR